MKMIEGALARAITNNSLTILASNRINLVHEDDRGSVGARHNEQLSDHSGAFTDVLLNQLSRLHFNELTVSVMGYSSGQESLSGAGGSVKEDTLRLGNSKSVEDLGMLDRKLNDLLHLLDLLVKPSNHVISGVGHFFDLHGIHQRVYLRWQDLVHEMGRVHGNAGVRSQKLHIDRRNNTHDLFTVSALLNQTLLLAHHLGYVSHR